MNRTVRRVMAGGLVALLGASLLVSVEPAPVASADPIIPTVDCFTPSAIFNTGHNAATGGFFPNGTPDVNWEISQQFTTTQSTWPAVVQFPSTATWTSATVNRNGAWIVSPFGDANWISGVTTGHAGSSELFYYRYRFQLAPEVNTSLFSLNMDFYADNTVHEAWVNGVRQSATSPSEFPSSPSLFFGAGFVAGNQSSLSLTDGWQPGPNEIVVQVGSAATHQGFLAQVTSQAECGPNAVDDTRPSVAPGGSITPFDPLLNDIAGTSPLAPATLTLDQSTAVGGTFTVSGGLVSFTASPSFTGTASIQYSISDTVGQSDTATIFVSVEATTGVTLEKRATPATVDAAGEIVTYEFEVTNTGNVPLSDVAVSETAFSGTGPVPVISCPADVLAAGASLTCTASYSVEQADMNAGSITNTAEVTGVPSVGDAVSASDTAVVSANENPLFTVSKTASSTTASPGDTVTYTVTVTNTGNQDFTSGSPASFTDDLSAVLDDATYNDDATNGATVSGSTLSWSGALAVGASETVTYSVAVNAPASGDRVMDNAVLPGVSGTCVAAADCVVSTPVRSYTVVKSASASLVNPGDTVTYEVTVTNTGAVAYTAGDPASFSDDLSAVLDDAAYNDDATNGATVSGDTLSWSGALAIGETVTVTYSATVNGAGGLGDGVLTNAVAPTTPGGGCPVAGDCVTTTDVAAFTVVKSASASVMNPGDVVTYTVEVTNTGAVDYTAGDLASFTDDLSDVLDDASYNDDATSGAVFDAATNVLSWSGDLAVGASETVTYSVTVNAPASGNRVIENAVIPSAPGGGCVDADDCVTTTDVRSFTVLKSADVSSVVPGDVVSYTVTVTNTGTADFTVGSPAEFSDDLSGVLDDATYNNDAAVDGVPSAAVSVSGDTLSWSGALAVGASVDVTYSVTVNDPVSGDQELRNVVVTTDTGNCPVGSADAACTTVSNSGSYTVQKSPSATLALPGDTVTYSVVVTNTGDVDFTGADQASFSDNLSDVLDDATFGSTTTPGASFDAATQILTWSGDLLVGQSVTVTYTVTVDSPPTGNFVLGNLVVPTTPGGGCEVAADCVTSTPVQAFTVVKTSSASVVNPGDVVTYSVEVTNTGAVAYAAGDPASFSDDLNAVLDDASYNDDATNGATVSGDTLSWSGALAVGETVTVTYSVTVNDAAGLGNGVLTNAVVPAGPGGGCVDADDCVTTTDTEAFTVVKTSSASGVNPGDTVTYEVTVTNTGSVAYTVGSPAAFSDDLSAVLDDAIYNDDATNGATVSGDTLSWSSALAVGESVTVSYSVTVNGAGGLGDGVLTNAVVPTGPGGGCPVAGDCVTTTDVAAFTVVKSASASVVNPDDVVTYTIQVTNTGGVDLTDANPAMFTDDLSGVLDDAVYNDDASLGGAYVEPVIAWAVSVDAGDTVTVVYSVTVSAPGSGDGRMVNAVVPDDEIGACAPEEACVTDTPVRSFTVVKSVDAGVAMPGQVLRYEIVVTNTGEADYTLESPASFVDDLSNVLDKSVFGNDATAGAVFVAPELTWRDALAVGESVTITYSVQLNAGVRPNADVVNTVFTPAGGSCPVPADFSWGRGAFSGGAFSASSLTTASSVEMPEGCVTSTEVSALALTGSSSVTVPWVASAALALMVGLGLLLIRRRRDAVQ